MLPRLCLSATETIIETDAEADACASRTFAANNAIAFEDVFADDARAIIERVCATAQFEAHHIDGLGPRLREAPRRTTAVLRGVLNRPVLRDWFARITGCGPLAGTKGSTARFLAGTAQRLDWHDDLNRDPRRLGITIGLGHEAYEGGLFEMKRKGSDDVSFRFHHVQPFAMLVFRVDTGLVHRVTPVTAGGPRTVFGGWFIGPEEPSTP
jgi:hypothetical protein